MKLIQPKCIKLKKKKRRKVFSLFSWEDHFICTLWHYFNLTVLKKIAAVPAISTSLLKHFVKWVENGAVGHPTTFALTLIVQAVSCLQIILNKRWFSLKFSRQINFSSFLVKLSWKNRLFWKNDTCQYLVLGSDFSSDPLSHPLMKIKAILKNIYSCLAFWIFLIEFILIPYEFLHIRSTSLQVEGWEATINIFLSIYDVRFFS